MNTDMLSDNINEIIGNDAQEVIIISDGELDIQNTSVHAEDIQTATFDKFRVIEKSFKETFADAMVPTKGVYIKIEKSLTSPLHIVLEHGEDAGQYLFIDIAENVKATVIEHHVPCDCGDCAFAGKVIPVKVEVTVGAGSNVTYSGFDTSGLEIEMERFIALQKDVSCDVALGMFGETCTSRNNIALAGTGAEVESKIMMFAQGTQKQLHKIKMFHFAPYTKSQIINHGVVADTAIGEFEGIGYIEKGAHQSDAQQESRIMALDDESRADVHPILLIDEHDVMAGHAGSVGRVSDEELFYLQSRGMTRKNAMLLVTEGFLRPVVADIADEQTRNRIETVIKNKIGLA